MKLFRRLFLITTFLLGLVFISNSYFEAKEYYSKFTSWEDFNRIVDNGEVIPNGTMLLGAGGNTLVFLTTTGAGTWTVPKDWNNLSNSVECISGGGGGFSSTVSDISQSGGGGSYAKKSNISLTPGGSVNYSVGVGGTGTQNSYTNNSTPGGDTWFNGATFAASSVGAKAGTSHQLGGLASSSIGDTKYNGGNGTEWQVSPARGSGGGAASAAGYAGNGCGTPGLYGAGGCSQYEGFGGSPDYTNGAQGLIVITYLPISTGGFNFFFF